MYNGTTMLHHGETLSQEASMNAFEWLEN